MDYARKKAYGGAAGLMTGGLILVLAGLEQHFQGRDNYGLELDEIGVFSFVIGLALLLVLLFRTMDSIDD